MTQPLLVPLARWIAGLTYERIPADALRAARFQALNLVAAVHAAARSEETASIARALTAPGRSTLLATGGKLAPVDAAFGNAAYSMAQDFDDILWMGHTGHSAVWASLAVAEHEGASARDFLTAVVAANEIAGRLGASSFWGPLNGQMTTFVHLVGAAAATARLLRLDADQTANALAISLAQPNFALQPGFMTPTSKLLTASIPTATGIRAAYFAKSGMTGEPRILEDRRGFWKRFSFLPMPMMLEGLGDFWALRTLTLKTFPGCHFYQTACTAVERLLHRRKAAEIRRVDIATTKFAVEVTRFASEYAAVRGTVTPVNVNFDLALTVAILFHAGELTSAQVLPEWLSKHSAELLRWKERIRVRHDPSLTARVLESSRGVATGRAALRSIRLRDLPKLSRRYAAEYESRLVSLSEAVGWIRAAATHLRKPAPQPSQDGAVPLYFPSRVTVELSNGARETEQVDLPVGSLASPQVESELRAKLRRETGSDGRLGESLEEFVKWATCR